MLFFVVVNECRQALVLGTGKFVGILVADFLSYLLDLGTGAVASLLAVMDHSEEPLLMFTFRWHSGLFMPSEC